MAQYKATIEGQRGSASRLGSKNSGMVAHVAGWNGGVKVVARYHANGHDVFEVYATSGSHNRRADIHIATLSADGDVLYSISTDCAECGATDSCEHTRAEVLK